MEASFSFKEIFGLKLINLYWNLKERNSKTPMFSLIQPNFHIFHLGRVIMFERLFFTVQGRNTFENVRYAYGTGQIFLSLPLDWNCSGLCVNTFLETQAS